MTSCFTRSHPMSRRASLFWLSLLVLVVAFVLATPVRSQTVPKFQRPVDDFDEEEFEDEFVGELTQDATPEAAATTRSVTKGDEEEDELEWDDYDAEEFVGLEELERKGAAVEEASTKTASTTSADLPPRSYTLEYAYLGLLFLFALNFIYGRHVNQTMAQTWALAFQDIFRKNFSKVGDGAVLTKESQSCFTLAATGRRNCAGLQATLELVKRHDLFSLLYGIVFPAHDLLTIEVPMNTESMEPFVFAVIKSKKEKQFVQENPDVAVFASKVGTQGLLPSSFTVLTDCKDLVPTFLHEHVTATLIKYEPYFESLHFTDQYPSLHFKKVLRFVFKIPPQQKMHENLEILLKMSLHFIDLVASTKVSAKAKSKAEKQRSKLESAARKEALQQRQEVAQQKKQEKKQTYLKELEKLPPEAQRRREEREYKRMLKKRMPKFKVSQG
ncbi:hypothetical protein QOT17_008445 [Balamuthia mandrillaris]